jgi:multicomponent Na+:H+ antiporter subunit D
MAQIGILLEHRHDALVLFACALITCGFFTKAAVVPFHFWLADAHAVSPTGVCVLFSGIMVELGLYAVLRVYTIVFIPSLDQETAVLRLILLSFASLTAIYGAFMCYAEHHIKRLLAFSTISHSGLMLIAIAIQGPIATAGFLMYLFAHALVKSTLFFVSGILLHRNRTASEPALFGLGRSQVFPGILWFLGGMGLAGLPGFATTLGEAFTSKAAESTGIGWAGLVFVISGILTAGAVFRVGFHTFFGWGSGPISDRAAHVDELPESRGDDHQSPWYLITPPAICIALAIGLTFIPPVREEVLTAADRLCFQAGYLHTVYKGSMTPVPVPTKLDLSLTTAAMRGIIAALLALALSLTSVFRARLKRSLRIGAFLEGRLELIRALQSGQVGDYVVWMTVGSSVLGTAYVIFLAQR